MLHVCVSHNHSMDGVRILREDLLPEFASTYENTDNIVPSMSGKENILGCRFLGEFNEWKCILNAGISSACNDCNGPGVTPVQSLRQAENGQPEPTMRWKEI